jgi:hypothetical protein
MEYVYIIEKEIRIIGYQWDLCEEYCASSFEKAMDYINTNVSFFNPKETVDIKEVDSEYWVGEVNDNVRFNIVRKSVDEEYFWSDYN